MALDSQSRAFNLCSNHGMKIRKETSEMNTAKICLAVVVGFGLGAFVYRPLAVRAQGRNPVIVMTISPQSGGTVIPPDARVVGFSCVSSGQCYLAAE